MGTATISPVTVEYADASVSSLLEVTSFDDILAELGSVLLVYGAAGPHYDLSDEYMLRRVAVAGRARWTELRDARFAGAQQVAGFVCGCGARGYLLEGATEQDREAFDEMSQAHESCDGDGAR